MAQQLPALVTLLTVVLLAVLSNNVGRARGKYGIHAPATSGPPEFERVYRAHMNTIESTIMFLPCLWLFAQHFGGLYGGLLGIVWLLARAWYAQAYSSGGNRGPAFTTAAVVNAILLIGALIGVIRAMVIMA